MMTLSRKCRGGGRCREMRMEAFTLRLRLYWGLDGTGRVMQKFIQVRCPCVLLKVNEEGNVLEKQVIWNVGTT
jgi:hypothetical protein